MPRKLIRLIKLFILVVTGVFGIILGSQLSKLKNTPSSPKMIENVAKYTSPKFNYSFDYPSNWKIRTTLKDDEMSTDLEFTIVSPPDSTDPLEGVSIKITNMVDGPLSIEWFKENELKNYPTGMTIEELGINEITFLSKRALRFKNGEILAQEGDYIYGIGWLHSGVSDTKNIQSSYNQILSTFKFVDSSVPANWKTYQSDTGQFSLQYPEKWNKGETNGKILLTPNPSEQIGNQVEGIYIGVVENVKNLTARQYAEQVIIPGQKGSLCADKIKLETPEFVLNSDVIMIKNLCGVLNQGPRMVIVRNNNIIDISSSLIEIDENLANQILSTFKFVQVNTGNALTLEQILGISFTLPSGWKIIPDRQKPDSGFVIDSKGVDIQVNSQYRDSQQSLENFLQQVGSVEFYADNPADMKSAGGNQLADNIEKKNLGNLPYYVVINTGFGLKWIVIPYPDLMDKYLIFKINYLDGPDNTSAWENLLSTFKFTN